MCYGGGMNAQVPATSQPIQKIKNKHKAILEMMVSNPEMTQRDIAKEFGMTEGWLSQIINSDIFQAQLEEMQEARFHRTLIPLESKLSALAHSALDELSDQMAAGAIKSQEALKETAEMALDRLGYSPKGNGHAIPGNLPPGATFERVTVPAETLQRARQNFGQKAAEREVNAPPAIEGSVEPVNGER